MVFKFKKILSRITFNIGYVYGYVKIWCQLNIKEK